jgi:dTDP-4-amino-4,6-dideoxygalactose transaminase
LQRHLAAANIDTGIHYPVPLHLQKAYERLGYKRGDFPITEKIASEILSLPIFPQLLEEQQARIVDYILRFLDTECRTPAGLQSNIQRSNACLKQ